MEKERKFFKVWMADMNDDIQNTAEAFSERFFLQQAFEAYDSLKFGETKNLLHYTINLHMVSLIKEDLGWYLSNGVISREGAESVHKEFDQAVKDFVPYMNDCLEGLNLFKVPQMHGQIAQQDYWKFAGGASSRDQMNLYDFTKPAKSEART